MSNELQKIGVVYALKDPRDGQIRYIGATTKDVYTRLSAHWSRPAGGNMKKWVSELKQLGLKLQLAILETVYGELDPTLWQMDVCESKWIEQHKNAGSPLLNVSGVKTKIRKTGVEKKGPLPGYKGEEKTKTTSLQLTASQIEWLKRQKGGASAFVRAMVDVKMRKEAKPE